MIVVTAGHVDHGKTTMLQALLGSRGLDRLPEEKRRGMTIDLGFAFLPVDDGEREETEPIAFIDVPGHKNYMRNMLCGVGGADFALLAVAADDGPMPQTLEHLAVLDLLHIRAGAILITRTDCVSRDRITQVRDEMQALIGETALGSAPIFQVSARSGDGIPGLRQFLLDAAAAMPARRQSGHFRLAMDRAFVIPGAGLVVTGTSVSGSVRTGEAVRVLGTGASGRVRTLHAQGRPVEQAFAGQRCAINLVGAALDGRSVERGDWIVAGNVAAPTSRFDARIRLLRSERMALSTGAAIHLYHGPSHVTGRVVLLDAAALDPGESALAQLVLDRAIGGQHGDRFVLRDHSASRTIGGGLIIDVFARARGRSRPARIDALAAMESAEPGQALRALLDGTAEGVDLDEFEVNRGLTASDATALYGTLPIVSIRTSDGLRGFSSENWARLGAEVLDELARWHGRSPDSWGPPADSLLKSTSFKLPRNTVLAVVSALADEGVIVRSAHGIRLPSHQPRLPSSERAHWCELEARLRDAGLRAPSVAVLSRATGRTVAEVEATLGVAHRCGLCIRISSRRYFLLQTIRALAERVQSLALVSPDRTVTVGMVRDHVDIGRRISVEVLDFFDRAGLTRRVKDSHFVIRTPRDVFPSAEDRLARDAAPDSGPSPSCAPSDAKMRSS